MCEQKKPQRLTIKCPTQRKPCFKPINQKNLCSDPGPQNKTFLNKKLNLADPNMVQIKSFNLKLTKLHCLLENKQKTPRSVFLSNIYRPVSQNKQQNLIENYLDLKNKSLIKENIQRLDGNLLNAMNTHVKCSVNRKVKRHSSFDNEPQTFRVRRQDVKSETVFLFQNQISQQKKKFNQHFDRSKYFNCQTLLNQQTLKNSVVRRQRTENRSYRRVKGQQGIQEKIRENQIIIMDGVVPIMKHKSNKPTTTGGFLKKYVVEELCLKPDSQFSLTQKDFLRDSQHVRYSQQEN